VGLESGEKLFEACVAAKHYRKDLLYCRRGCDKNNDAPYHENVGSDVQLQNVTIFELMAAFYHLAVEFD
jgi:hypothetical protein